MNIRTEILIPTFLLLFTEAISNPSEESLERKFKDDLEAYIITIKNKAEDQDAKGIKYYQLPAQEKEEQLVDTIEYDDNLVVPAEDSNQPTRRKLWYPREFPKKREFLQCKSEEPIIFLCHKSCHNVFKSICQGHQCPPRLIVQTNTQCYERCKKAYKEMRGMKYIPPEKYK